MTRLRRLAEQLNYNSEGRAICPECGSELTVWYPGIRHKDGSCTHGHWYCEDCQSPFAYDKLNIESK